MSEQTVKAERKRTTFRLPIALRKEIAHEAVETDRDMTSIIIEQLSKRYPALSPAKSN